MTRGGWVLSSAVLAVLATLGLGVAQQLCVPSAAPPPATPADGAPTARECARRLARAWQRRDWGGYWRLMEPSRRRAWLRDALLRCALEPAPGVPVQAWGPPQAWLAPLWRRFGVAPSLKVLATRMEAFRRRPHHAWPALDALVASPVGTLDLHVVYCERLWCALLDADPDDLRIRANLGFRVADDPGVVERGDAAWLWARIDTGGGEGDGELGIPGRLVRVADRWYTTGETTDLPTPDLAAQKDAAMVRARG